jgi:hypothetical protein
MPPRTDLAWLMTPITPWVIEGDWLSRSPKICPIERLLIDDPQKGLSPVCLLR